MNDKLDNMLKEWAGKRAVSEMHLNELTRRITSEASRRRYVCGLEKTGPEVSPFWNKLAHAGLGAAVTLVVALFYFQWFVSHRLPYPGNGEASSLAAIPPRQIDSGRRLFSEMERLFSDRLRWIAESNGDMGIGVESLQGGLLEDSPPMLVRLMVISRKSGESAWRSVWNTDVLLRGEEVVEVVPNRESDNRLTLWVYPLADGKVAVDTSLSLEIPVRLSSRLNMVVQQGEPSEIMSLRIEEMEYRVFQTVTTLGHGAT